MNLDDALQRIDTIGLSHLAHHDAWCCSTARALLVERLTAPLEIGAALAGIPDVVRWAPTAWPYWWCEIDPEEPQGDCGVHADLASALLESFGMNHRRGRAALAPGPLVAAHWQAQWSEAQVADTWLGRSIVHHEVVHIGSRWWDPSGARWFAGAGSRLGSGWVLAVRDEDGGWHRAESGHDHERLT